MILTRSMKNNNSYIQYEKLYEENVQLRKNLEKMIKKLDKEEYVNDAFQKVILFVCFMITISVMVSILYIDELHSKIDYMNIIQMKNMENIIKIKQMLENYYCFEDFSITHYHNYYESQLYV